MSHDSLVRSRKCLTCLQQCVRSLCLTIHQERASHGASAPHATVYNTTATDVRSVCERCLVNHDRARTREQSQEKGERCRRTSCKSRCGRQHLYSLRRRTTSLRGRMMLRVDEGRAAARRRKGTSVRCRTSS